MTIDAHQHFWKYDPLHHGWISEEMGVLKRDFAPADLEKELKKYDVEGTIAVQALANEEENSFLLKQAEKYDFIKGIVSWVDLTDSEVEKRLDFYKENHPKIKGFRHLLQDEADIDYMLNPDFCRGMAMLEKYGYTYDLLISPVHLHNTLQLVKQFPDQPFVIDHLAKPEIKEQNVTAWRKGMEEISIYPNVYGKVSGMITEADWENWTMDDLKPYLDIVFELFGYKRILFGSDWPVCLLAGSYGEVKAVVENYLDSFTRQEKEAVMGENAVHFYRL